MQATVEYEPIVKKLLEKSEEGRLNWVKGVRPRRAEDFRELFVPRQPRIFYACTIEGQYTFESERAGDSYLLTIWDSDGDALLSLTGEPAVVYDDPKKEELFNMLRDIYELARKKALNVDEKIATATGLLDKI